MLMTTPIIPLNENGIGLKALVSSPNKLMGDITAKMDEARKDQI